MPEAGIFKHIPVDQIQPNLGNPRKSFDEEALKELAASIKEHGVVEPLVVTQDDAGGYVLVCGERRWRAAQMAGAEELPCIVRDLTPAQAAEIMLIENVQRRDLDPIDEAKAFQALISEHGYTQESLAAKLGLSQGQIANRMRLLRLPAEVQDSISRKILPAAAGLELLKLEQSPLLGEVATDLLKHGETSTRAVADAVTCAMRNHSKTLESGSKYGDGPRFDTAACQGCRSVAKVTMWNGEPASRCLNPQCWEMKQAQVRREQERARLAELETKGEKLRDIKSLNYSDYVRFDYSSEWKGIDQAGCQECEKRTPVRDHGGAIVDVCLNPLCHRKKKNAVTRAENAVKRTALEVELDEIAARASKCGTERRMFVYLAALLLREVRSEYERPTCTKYLKDAFGLEDGFWKSAYEMRGQAFEKVIERLEALTTEQLVKGILFAWPAVAIGTKDKLIRYALQMDDAREVAAAEPVPSSTTTPAPPDEAEVPDQDTEEPETPSDPDACPLCGEKLHHIKTNLGPTRRCPKCLRLPDGDVEELLASVKDEHEPGQESTAPEAGSSDEFAGFLCPDCGSEMNHRPKYKLLQCVNEDCDRNLMTACLTEEEARELMSEKTGENGAATEAGNVEPREDVGPEDWGRPAIKGYVDHATGKYYEISQGLRDTEWGLFERKQNGSLRRVRGVAMVPDRKAAEDAAAKYAEAHGWVADGAEPGDKSTEKALEVRDTKRRYCQLCSTNTKQDLVEIDGAKKWKCQDCDHCYSYRGPKAVAAAEEADLEAESA